MEQFQRELVFKAHRLLYRSALGSRVIKKRRDLGGVVVEVVLGLGRKVAVDAPRVRLEVHLAHEALLLHLHPPAPFISPVLGHERLTTQDCRTDLAIYSPPIGNSNAPRDFLP